MSSATQSDTQQPGGMPAKRRPPTRHVPQPPDKPASAPLFRSFEEPTASTTSNGDGLASSAFKHNTIASSKPKAPRPSILPQHPVPPPPAHPAPSPPSVSPKTSPTVPHGPPTRLPPKPDPSVWRKTTPPLAPPPQTDGTNTPAPQTSPTQETLPTQTPTTPQPSRSPQPQRSTIASSAKTPIEKHASAVPHSASMPTIMTTSPPQPHPTHSHPAQPPPPPPQKGGQRVSVMVPTKKIAPEFQDALTKALVNRQTIVSDRAVQPPDPTPPPPPPISDKTLKYHTVKRLVPAKMLGGMDRSSSSPDLAVLYPSTNPPPPTALSKSNSTHAVDDKEMEKMIMEKISAAGETVSLSPAVGKKGTLGKSLKKMFSMKPNKSKGGSLDMEDLTEAKKEKLGNFLAHRPSFESLIEKGILHKEEVLWLAEKGEKEDDWCSKKEVTRAATPPAPTAYIQDHLLLTTLCDGYILEVGTGPTFINGKKHSYELEDRDGDIAYYNLYFHGKEHINFIGVATEDSSVAVLSIETQLPPDRTMLRALIRTKKGDERVSVAPASGSSDLLKAVRMVADPQISTMKMVKIKDTELHKELATFENQMIDKTYKWGVLLCKAGQTDEDDMFANVEGSKDWEEFLDFLGTRVTLQGFTKFRGGLDVKTNSTGTHSVYTQHNDMEIMFHVSTLLPHYELDKQQVEKKRHLGNDIVVIVFKDGTVGPTDAWNSLCIHSQFNLVQVDKKVGDKTYYKVAIMYKDSMHEFGPKLPSFVFEKGPEFREFFITKLINGERAALASPTFRTKLMTTKKTFLKSLADKYIKN